MNKGLELILLRLDSHPEEFKSRENIDDKLPRNNRGYKWRSVVKQMLDHPHKYPFIDSADLEKLSKKYWALQEKSFNHLIMDMLLQVDDD